MSEKNEQKYRVTSPIKRGGKRYEVNDSIFLTEKEAEGLHVEPFNSAVEAGKSPEPAATSPSLGMSAEGAVKVIENSDLKDLKGFVVAPPEDRKTVLAAWKAKQEEKPEVDTKDDKKKS